MYGYAGQDPLTRKPLYHRKTVKGEREAQIALGKLLELAEAERRSATRRSPGRRDNSWPESCMRPISSAWP